MLKIGSLKLPTNVLLAPLAGISDSSFRLLCRRFGARFTFIEMINARAVSHNNKKTKKMLAFDPHDKPIGVQIVGAELPFLMKAVETLERYDFDLLDFNAACPVRKVCRRGEGAALMKDPKKFNGLLSAIVRHTARPVTVKIRSGWDRSSKNAVTIARVAQDAGAAAVFIHGRERDQLYKGNVDYAIIADVKKAVCVPVIASGDIWSADHAQTMFRETGCDGILVARGCLGNPWIFREIDARLKGHASPPPPSTEEIVATILAHLDLSIVEHGEKNAVPLMRKFVGWYLKGKPYIRTVRQRVNGLKTKKEFSDLMDFVCALAQS